jgi:cytochrome c oxidase assembly protein subunit 15
MGTIPPLNAQQWQEAFDKYKTIPQYQLVNYDFTLSDFKNIFMWEYLHRLVGRLLGVVFLLPFAWFLITKQLDRAMIRKSLFLFALGGLQGFLGWYMVSSGLTEHTSVSQYRLAVHLITAFITYGFTFWFALELMYRNQKSGVINKSSLSNLVKLIFITVVLQIIYGAFVAGLHAGKIANTWPTMDGAWVPDGMASMSPWWKNFFENLLCVQFIHRSLAIIIVGLSSWLWFASRKTAGKSINAVQFAGINFLLFAISVQFVLGVFTLLTKVQIALAVFHQMGAFMLFSACVFLLFQSYKTSCKHTRN